jgi:hypothetical protein
MEMGHLDGRQVTLPLFDKQLLSADEEMAQPLPQKPGRRAPHITIKGGVDKGHGPGKRVFVAGSIRMGRNHTE